MTIAVDRPQFNREREKETDFIDIVVWQKQAETCANNLGKGRLIAVEGRLQIRSYDDKQGIRRKTAEVVADSIRFLDWPKDRDNQGGGHYDSGSAGGFGSEISFNGDDIPF